jgi:hypothetical protein
MEAICSSEMSVDIQRTTRRYIPEDGTLHNHRCENLGSYSIAMFGLSQGNKNITLSLRSIPDPADMQYT